MRFVTWENTKIFALTCLALAVVIAVGTVCYGFVDRGHKLSTNRTDRHEMLTLLRDTNARNADLERQLDVLEAASARRAARAAKQRDELAAQVRELTAYLRAKGIDVPAAQGLTVTPRPGSSNRAVRAHKRLASKHSKPKPSHPGKTKPTPKPQQSQICVLGICLP